MNLWLRLLMLLLSARGAPKISAPDGVSVLRFRVWPHDLDLSAHMNNGRYLAIMDLGRIDYMLRLGLWSAVRRYRWTPVANAALVRFRRELRLFDRYRLETRIVAWAETTVVMEQTFVFEGGAREGQVAARALFKGGVYDRSAGAFVPVARMMAEAGIVAESPAQPEPVAAFLAADTALRKSDTAGAGD